MGCSTSASLRLSSSYKPQRHVLETQLTVTLSCAQWALGQHQLLGPNSLQHRAAPDPSALRLSWKASLIKTADESLLCSRLNSHPCQLCSGNELLNTDIINERVIHTHYKMAPGAVLLPLIIAKQSVRCSKGISYSKMWLDR